jgi:hypothetical protein
MADVLYMELLDHSKKLGRVGNWDWARTFGAAGLLSLGAGLGASVSGDGGTAGVVTCLLLGLILLLCGLFIRRERVESVGNLKSDFDQMLSYYEHEPELRAMREQYGSDPAELPPGASLPARARKFFRL